MAIIKKFRIKSFKNINTIIEFKDISLAYGNRLILDKINFSINEGQIFGMLGPNGVGKSTIFNLITGLIMPKDGKILINGQDVTSFPIYLSIDLRRILLYSLANLLAAKTVGYLGQEKIETFPLGTLWNDQFTDCLPRGQLDASLR